MYRDMAVSCFRFGWCRCLAEVDDMTILEYRLRCEAFNLEMVDRSYFAHLSAWLSFKAQATRQSGKKSVPVYNHFKKFFDYDKELDNVKGVRKRSRFDGIGKLLRKGGSDG